MTGRPGRPRMLSMNMLRARRQLLEVTAILSAVLLWTTWADATRFGRNKVQYRDFEWKIVHTEHFDVYFYDGSEDLADAVCLIIEESNAKLERTLGHELTTVIPIIIYASHNDFEQTNVTSSHIEESVGGFTELFKNRVAVPFTGSYADLRHVLYHELTHVFMFDIVYGGLVESVVRQAYMNPVPLWFTEGLAEYASQGWDGEAEMILRDITIADMVVPLEYLSGGYLVYKEGQAAVNFIADRYGEEKIPEIVRGLARTRNLDRALRDAIGLSTPELTEELDRWLKTKYWPEVAGRKRAEDVARLVTDHRRDTSYLNLGPEVSPDGNRVVFVSDRSGYTDVYLASTLDGSILSKLVGGGSSDEFETLHILRTGFAWSPDGEMIAFVAKAGASDALHVLEVENGERKASLRFPLDGVFTPCWSPDGERIAFVGTKDGASDIYVTDAGGSGELIRLTDDYDDERDPSWSPDGRRVAFASDRDSPPGLGFARTYDIFAIDVETREVERVVATRGNDGSPAWSPDGRLLAYSSDRDGSPELYFADLERGMTARATHLIGGAEAPSWSAAGDRLVFSHYGDGGWDVAAVKDPLDVFGESLALHGWFPSEEGASEPHGPPQPGADGDDVAPEDVGFDDEPLADATPDGERGAPSEPADAGGDTVSKVRGAFLAANPDAPSRGDDEVERVPGTVETYRPRFTPDWVSGGLSYNSGYGLSGGAQIAVSDVLGNHRFYIASDFFSSIESSNFYVIYEHLARRLNYSIGVYNFKEYYYSDRTRLGEDLGEKRYFTERSYGIAAGFSYPFSRFTRVEFDASAISLERQFAEENEDGEVELTDEEVSRSLVIPSLSLINDTTLWGTVGPIAGGRSSFVVSRAWEPSGDFEYTTAIVDVRRYVRIGVRHSLALKLVGARSVGPDAQTFVAGGVNSIRGYEDFEFGGRNLALASLEFRYPFIDHLRIASPLPITLWGLRGVAFLDAGAAWDDDFRGVVSQDGVRLKDIKASIGVGVRMRLAFFVVRVDRAWQTDFQETGAAMTHFALGAEF